MASLSIGLDVGGTKVLAVALDPGGDIVAEAKEATPTQGDELIGCLVDMSRRVADAAGGRIGTVGIGLPGLVDRDGTMRAAPNLPSVVPLETAEVGRALEVPVASQNDATVAALAEYSAGAGRGSRVLVMATLGTGIGGGFVVDGAPLLGAHGFAGEIGHFPVVPDGGAPCPCGQRGCWEQYASGTGLARMASERFERDVQGEEVVELARRRDETALSVLKEFASWLGLGLATVILALDPDRIVLGGGLVAAADVFLEDAEAVMLERLPGSEERPRVAVVAASLGERAGAIGAAQLGATLGEGGP